MVNTIYSLMEHIEQNHLEKVAFRYMNHLKQEKIEITYKQYIEDIQRFASYLASTYKNIESTQIGLLGSNSYEYAVALMACYLVKAIPVTFNVQDSFTTILSELEIVDVSVLYLDPSFLVREGKSKEDLGVIVQELSTVLMVEGNKEVVFSNQEDLEKLGMIMFTSGTTGKNKAVMLSVKNIGAIIVYGTEIQSYCKEYMQMDEFNACLIVPLYHVSGLQTIFSQFYLGGAINIVLNMKYLMKDMVMMSCQHTMIPPVVLDMFYGAIMKGAVQALGNIRIIYSAGASLDHSKIEAFKQYGFTILDAYGMTETAGVGTLMIITQEEDEYRRNHSIGTQREQCNVRIIDDEICFKGDSVFMGYYGAPELTKEVIDEEGWFHSGDLGYKDEAGYVFITGRKKNLIILDSGENVSPEELESLILKNKKVLECIVKEKNKRIAVEVYCKEEDQEEVREFIKEVNKQVALYKRITLVEFRNEPFEKNAMGKTKR